MDGSETVVYEGGGRLERMFDIASGGKKSIIGNHKHYDFNRLKVLMSISYLAKEKTIH